MFPDEIGLNFGGGFPADGGARRPQVAAIDALIGGIVEAVALALCPFACKTDIEPVIDDGDIDHAFEPALMIIAQFAGRHCLELIGGFGGDEIDHAGGRIAAIERALGPAQNLDLADVVEFLFEEMVSDKRHVVEGDSHGGICRHRDRLRADAANLDAVAGEIRFGEGEVRHLFHQIGAACGLRGGELFLTEGRDRNGNGLHIGAAQFRRCHGHGFDRRPWRGGLRDMHRQLGMGDGL